MWGANAVNGIINIISKHSRSQAGGAVNLSAGTQGMGNVYARIGQADESGSSLELSSPGPPQGAVTTVRHPPGFR